MGQFPYCSRKKSKILHQQLQDPLSIHMSRTKYICSFLLLLIFSRCTPVDQSLTPPTVNPIDLLISSEDMPTGWKSYEVFSDEYDDQCYIDCAIIQFSPAEKDGVYSEQTVYVYNTIEEAGRN